MKYNPIKVAMTMDNTIVAMVENSKNAYLSFLFANNLRIRAWRSRVSG